MNCMKNIMFMLVIGIITINTTCYGSPGIRMESYNSVSFFVFDHTDKGRSYVFVSSMEGYEFEKGSDKWKSVLESGFNLAWTYSRSGEFMVVGISFKDGSSQAYKASCENWQKVTRHEMSMTEFLDTVETFDNLHREE